MYIGKKNELHRIQDTGFILVRPVILGTYGPHGGVMRFLKVAAMESSPRAAIL